MRLPSIPTLPLLFGLAKDRRLITVALICAALITANVLFSLFVAAPSAAGLRELESRYAEFRKRNVEAMQFQKQKQDLAGIKTGIQTQKDMPLLVKDLVQSARGLNLRVGPINYDIPKPGSGGLAMLTFSFPAEGRYPDVKRFIYETETSRRLVGIQDVKLDAEKGGVKLQVKLVTYIKSSEDKAQH
jgi:Tfp pilus assembly protein PilO